MPDFEVRPFRRADRDQLTQLINAHAQAVVPGMTTSVSALLSSLERQPGDFIEDPWVAERATLVAVQRDRIAAAAHLLRYHEDDRTGPAARNVGMIAWFVYWPTAPAGNECWPDATQAAEGLMAACISTLTSWRVTRQQAGGELPVPGVYGVPEQWPHIRALYHRAGFRHDGHTEIVYLAGIDDLPGVSEPPIPGLTVERTVGINGTRLTAMLGADRAGYIEVEVLDTGERSPRGGWADIGNLHVSPEFQRRGVATWLVSLAAEWFRMARVGYVLDYAWLSGTDPGGLNYDGYRAFLPTVGFRELTRTERGWTREPEERVSDGSVGPGSASASEAKCNC